MSLTLSLLTDENNEPMAIASIACHGSHKNSDMPEGLQSTPEDRAVNEQE
jgi:hypothetical protein